MWSKVRWVSGLNRGRATAMHRTSNHAHTLMPKRNLERPINPTIMFGLYEEARVPREKPRMCRDNMETLCLKGPGWDSDPGVSCCKATALTTPHKLKLNKSSENTS
ncbi:hypothetical protein GOODEAATRI_011049 [Goodea atripinnis]|uniref:Protein Wnt n=1 Tax=Goodea atripinnis TaxID=208336 RepID=A0ABV0MSJ6_9TELE